MNTIKNIIEHAYRFLELGQVISPKSLCQLERQRYVQGLADTTIGTIRYVDAQTFLSGMREIFIDEIYEVGRWNSDRPVVIDCGANIGLSALYFARRQKAQVYAFEADPKIFQILKDNIDKNCFEENVTVFNKAVWISDEGVDFDIEGGYSGQIHQHGHELVKEAMRVPSLRLRDFIDSLEKVDLLKLDIEGAEKEVMPDCEGVLNKINYIFMEYHSSVSDPQMLGEILDILKREGFRYHIKEAFVSEKPFVKINEMCGMDLQLNIFATNRPLGF